MEKRKRGGQKSNQNARKHGFYSGTLSHAEITELWKAINVERVDLEIAILRLKLKSFIRQNAGNPYVLREAARLIVKWSRKKNTA